MHIYLYIHMHTYMFIFTHVYIHMKTYINIYRMVGFLALHQNSGGFPVNSTSRSGWSTYRFSEGVGEQKFKFIIVFLMLAEASASSTRKPP